MLYQNTPRASKNNAFCWETWQGQIKWSSAAQAAQSLRVREGLSDGLTTPVNLRGAVAIDPTPQASADRRAKLQRGGL